MAPVPAELEGSSHSRAAMADRPRSTRSRVPAARRPPAARERTAAALPRYLSRPPDL